MNKVWWARTPMQHAKFHCNRPSGSREENFEGFLPYMGVAFQKKKGFKLDFE